MKLNFRSGVLCTTACLGLFAVASVAAQDKMQDKMSDTMKPMMVSGGEFAAREAKTSGHAAIVKGSDGNYKLELSNFSTDKGPDLHVLLVKPGDKALAKKTVDGKFDKVELGALKNQMGDQTYDIPANTDLKKFSEVVVFCEQAHVVFGSASLKK